jgi:glycosyltransferase involved in cell wall biosynthesis
MEYKLSVRLMTYMHESFIKQAMDGIMMQKTNFKIEVVVGDDFSTDRTLDIIKSFQNTDHIHIKILERKIGDAYWQKRQNLGRLHNFFNILENCLGRYVALLDGDDFWTDPYKLQKQVDFLEANEAYVLCATRVEYVDDNGSHLRDFGTDGTYTINDLAKENLISTPTAVYRVEGLKQLPNWILNCPVADWPLWLFLSQQGKVQILEDITTCYRVHSGGIWGANINNGKAIKNVQSLLLLFMILRDKFSDEINVLLQENYIRQVIKMIQLHLKRDNLSEVSRYMKILFSEGYSLTTETNALTEAITNKIEIQAMELKDAKAFNTTLMTSTSYRSGRKLTSLFSFLKKI